MPPRNERFGLPLLAAFLVSPQLRPILHSYDQHCHLLRRVVGHSASEAGGLVGCYVPGHLERTGESARASDFDLVQRPVAELEHAIAGGERATRAYREALATFESAGEDKAEATEAERRLRTYPDGSTAQTADGQ